MHAVTGSPLCWSEMRLPVLRQCVAGGGHGLRAAGQRREMQTSGRSKEEKQALIMRLREKEEQTKKYGAPLGQVCVPGPAPFCRACRSVLGLTIACMIGNCHWRGGSHRSRRWRLRYVHDHSVHMPARKAARPRASLRACASVDREATRMTVRRAQAGTKWTRAWAASARATLAVSERCIAENARTRQSSKDVACAFSKALCLVAQGQASCQMCAGVIAGTETHARTHTPARVHAHTHLRARRGWPHESPAAHSKPLFNLCYGTNGWTKYSPAPLRLGFESLWMCTHTHTHAVRAHTTRHVDSQKAADIHQNPPGWQMSGRMHTSVPVGMVV